MKKERRVLQSIKKESKKERIMEERKKSLSGDNGKKKRELPRSIKK
jgi:hypothetical protein